MIRRILYLSHATPDVYDIIRNAAPSAGFVLVTLNRDSDDERIEKIQDADTVIVAASPLRRSLIDAAARLSLVHHQGVGYQDTVDCDALAARGIALAMTTAGTTEPVAEHAVLLMLATLRRLPFADSELRQGRWHITALRPVSRELRGMTVGFLGMGRIGQAVAERLVSFGVRGLYHDPKVRLEAAREAALNLRPVSFDDLLSQADIVTLHIPATTHSRHIINRAALSRMKRGAYLINTARGALVDESALIAALTQGHLAGAGLDVFETEPPKASPLFRMPNVVLTPHISAGTRDALAEKMAAIFSNIARFYHGEPLENQILPSRMDAVAQ